MHGLVKKVGAWVKDIVLARDSRTIVFRAEGCGLANRLRALVGYQALASLRKLPFHLAWTPDTFCPSEFKDLFDSPIDLLSQQELRSISPRAIYREEIWFENIWMRWGEGIDWTTYLREVHDCLSALALQPAVAAKVAEFRRIDDLSDAVGVHIRNTDNVANYAEWMKHYSDFDPKQISTVAGFVNMIGASIQSRPVFLATDDPELEKTLKQRFPPLLTFPKSHDVTKLRTTSVAAALSELWLLGRCHHVVGTYYSSFGELSAIWGKIPYFKVGGDQIVRCAFVDRMISTGE